MLEWFYQKTFREQVLLTIAIIFIIFYLILELIISPLIASAKSERENYIKQLATLQLLKQAQPYLIEAKNNANKNQPFTAINPTLLLPTIDNLMNQARLKTFIVQMSQSSDNEVSIEFAHIPFDSLIQVLIQAWQQHHIFVKTLSARPTTPTGTAAVSLKISV